MKRFLLATLIVTVLILLAAPAMIAQDPPEKQTKLHTLPAQSVPAAQPSAEQKARLTELAKTWDAQIRAADAARDKYMIALLSTLAELGLKPSETAVSWNEKGEPVFQRVEQAKTPTQKPPTTEAKP